jgi:hypothetical protein
MGISAAAAAKVQNKNFLFNASLLVSVLWRPHRFNSNEGL